MKDENTERSANPRTSGTGKWVINVVKNGQKVGGKRGGWGRGWERGWGRGWGEYIISYC